MVKKSVSQNIFSVTTKNSNWEILTQNLVTLNDKIVLRIKIFSFIFWWGWGVHWKIQFLRVQEKPTKKLGHRPFLYASSHLSHDYRPHIGKKCL